MSDKIENWLNENIPMVWAIVAFVLKWRIAFVVTVIFFYVKYHQQNTVIIEQGSEIDTLTKTNAYLLTESRSGSKTVNEIPFGYWKKMVNVDTERITMFRYNDAFYEYLLKPMDLNRYYFVGKSDYAVFPFDEADSFYKEDWALVQEFLLLQESGKNPRVLSKHYENTWKNLQGEVNKSGYTRWVFEEEGHVYVCGMTDDPVLK